MATMTLMAIINTARTNASAPRGKPIESASVAVLAPVRYSSKTIALRYRSVANRAPNATVVLTAIDKARGRQKRRVSVFTGTLLRYNAPVQLQASQIKARGEATRNPKIACQLQRSLARRRRELKRR